VATISNSEFHTKEVSDCSSICLPLPGVEQKQQHVQANKQKRVTTTFSDNISPEWSRIRIMDTAGLQ